MAERTEAARVRLEPWSEDDLDLLRRTNAPEMMEHLGGPESEEQLLARHQRYLDGAGPSWMFRIVLLPEEEVVGSVGYWKRYWREQTVYEIGWSVLPPFQGRGIAVAAAGAAAERTRADGRHRYVHAFPSVDNPASNAVCKRLGFEFLAEYDLEYPPGHTMRCNDWRLDLGRR